MQSMSLRKLVVRLENTLAPTRKLAKNWKPTLKKPTHTPALANKVGPSTTAPTRKMAAGESPRSSGHTKPGYKMVFGRMVKVSK